jgi:Domain of unknown function (DUF4375)
MRTRSSRPTKPPETRARRPKPGRIRALKDGALYWRAIKPIWDAVSIYHGGVAFLKQFSRVNRAQGLLLAAHWCQSEVCNGGFHQFFHNSTGVLAPEAIEGFRFLGMLSAARIASRATRWFGDPYPRARGDRIKRLDALMHPGEEREDCDPFYKLDDTFFATDDIKVFRTKADAFVRANLHLFFR